MKNSCNQPIGYLGKNHVNEHSVTLDFEILCSTLMLWNVKLCFIYLLLQFVNMVFTWDRTEVTGNILNVCQ